ncbi:MAG: histidine kinase [Verrucomicrobia bacterium]|jgi:hypothetical protein|nr:histidine kinase [Verrucomicrobiota bacterium]
MTTLGRVFRSGLSLGLLAIAIRAAEGPARPERDWRHPLDWTQGTVRASVQRWFAELPPQLRYSEARWRPGDDGRWAGPEFADQDWPVTGYWNLPARAGVFWVRFRVRMEPEGARLPGGLLISTVMAYEIFWDGVRLGESGVPGNDRAAEVPGRVDRWFSLPDQLRQPGEHVVALRLSSHRCGFPAAQTGLRLLIDEPERLQRVAVREALVPTLAAGAAVMAGLAGFIMWLVAARRPTLLLLTGMCLSAAAMQALHAHRWFFQYPADWHYPVLLVMAFLVGLQGICLVAFLLVHFAVPGARWLPAALVAVYVVVSWWSPARLNLEGVHMLGIGMAVALACAGWAAWRRRQGAWPALIGVWISGAALSFEPSDYRTNFFVKFLPAMLGLTAALAVRLRDERLQARSAQLTAARLELELLKKNIQPHFLLNTLATVLETIEQEPRVAAALVEALAGEFRVLSRVAGEKLIPLSQELELCRAHLRVMSLRKEAPCTLDTTGVDETTPVPPALFHTLIENGLTHLRPRDGRYEFILRQERTPAETRYRLVARGVRGPEAAEPGREGTGLRYLKARLEESCTGRWTLAGGPVPEGWETCIGIRSAGGEGLTPAAAGGGLGEAAPP